MSEEFWLSTLRLESFSEESTVAKYVEIFRLRELFGASEESTESFETANRLHAVSPANQIPYPIKWDDLARLHWLMRSRRVARAVEFGSGYSTAVLAHALSLNEGDFSEEGLNERRFEKPFTLFSIDESAEWLEKAIERTPASLRKHVFAFHSEVSVGTFEGRFCTYFDDPPNIVGDLVYLDGPSQFAVKKSFRGFNPAEPSLMPMAADLLRVEHFFEPGAVIIVDGRTSNARFLREHFRRGWKHKHFFNDSFHLFELCEEPLGKINQMRLERLEPTFLLG